MTIKEFVEKINNGEASVLTLEAAKALKGDSIYWMYFGYNSNENTVSEMIVGDIVSVFDYAKKQYMEGYISRAAYWESYMTEEKLDEVKTQLVLLDNEGKDRYIYCHTKYFNFFEEPTFTCSDADREVYYIRKPNNRVRGKKLLPDKEKFVCEKYMNGTPLRDILTLTGLSQSTIMSVLRRNNVPLRNKKRLSVKQEEDVVRLYKSGESIARIKSETGVRSEQTIYRILRDAKIDLRKSREAAQ
jgi:hypothetical protein